MSHEYLSTACAHAQQDGDEAMHAACRNQCKYCSSVCVCSCHGEAGTQSGTGSSTDQARDLARELLEHATLPPELAERIRTDPALFWARGEEQPPGEWAGNE